MQKNRKQKKRLIKNKKLRFGLKVFGVTLSVLGSLALVFAFAVIFGIVNITEGMTINKLSLKYNSFIYAYDNKGDEQLFEPIHGSVNRVWVDYTEMPPNLRNAIVAIEDERFYKHKGFDFKSTTKAAFDYILRRPGGRGASTLTQQLIKNITGNSKVEVSRKAKEILQALQLERKMSKEQILEMYLNTIYLSNGCNGVRTASELFFGKSVNELKLDECALLAGITQYPSKFDPFRHYDSAEEKRDTVLNKMQQLGYISSAECEEAKSKKTKIAQQNRDRNAQSYYADQVIDDVIEDLQDVGGYSEQKAESMVYNGGLKIYACVDPTIQKISDKVYNNKANFPTQSGKTQPNSAIAIMDNYNGQVKALVGGRGKKVASRTFNRATQSLRQPGSSFKPVAAYAPAVEKGLITPSTMILDGYIRIGNWAPKNYDRRFHGNVSVAYAVANSTNTVAVRVVQKAGIDYAFKFAKSLGITSLQPSDKNLAALSLGGLSKGVSPLEMAAAYSTFANSGMYSEPITYTKVLNADGDVILENKNKAKVVMKKKTAQTMLSLLKGVTTYGNATAARFSSKYDVVGKTGTTNENKDRWFCSITPYYTSAVWFGFDQAKEMHLYGTNPCILVWRKIMQEVSTELKLPAKSLNTSAVKGTIEESPTPTAEKEKKEKKDTKKTTQKTPAAEEPTLTDPDPAASPDPVSPADPVAPTVDEEE